jgi:hypothetical protein
MALPLIPEDFNIKNPEFEYRNKDVMALELAVQFGENKDKYTKSTITFRTSQIGGYDMQVRVGTGYDRKNMKQRWAEPYPTGEISIEFTGEYERDILIAAFQKIGLLSSLTYGKIGRSSFEPPEEEQDAIRKQTPPV